MPVFLQIKCERSYLTPAAFLKALLTTSPGAFYLDNDERDRLSQQPRPESSVSGFTRAIRIIFSFHGFSKAVISSVNAYNEAHEQFPILLLVGTPKLLGSFYEELSYKLPQVSADNSRDGEMDQHALRFIQALSVPLSPLSVPSPRDSDVEMFADDVSVTSLLSSRASLALPSTRRLRSRARVSLDAEMSDASVSSSNLSTRRRKRSTTPPPAPSCPRRSTTKIPSSSLKKQKK